MLSMPIPDLNVRASIQEPRNNNETNGAGTMICTRSHRYLTLLFFIGVLAQGSFPLSLGQEILLTDDPTVILKVAHHTGLGIEFSNKGEFEKAVDAYTTALQYPKNSMTHTLLLNRGASYVNLQKYEEALQDGETAIVLRT